MATLFGTYTAPRAGNPQGLVDGSVQGGHVRVYREKIILAGQGTADTVTLCYPSAGETFLGGVMTADVSLGTSLVSIGTPASPGKYRAAAAFTSIDTPSLFGRTAPQGAKLALDETVIMTIGTAALPVAGTLIVDLYFAQS